jgi:prephenate dehydrogenase
VLDEPKWSLQVTIGIIGTGLIGASIGMGLKAKGHRVLGFDQSVENTDIALRRYAIDEAASLAEASAADVVFVAVPPAVTVQVLEAVYAARGASTVVTDTASIKGDVVAWGAEKEWFIASHPMAGHEKGGPKFASNWMFRGAKWILCPGAAPASLMSRLESVIQELDATPVRLSASEHDKTAAILSHLPHVLAGLLLETGSQLESTEASGGSWKDLTRVGGVDPELWTQILLGNRTEITSVLEGYAARLTELNQIIASGDKKGIEAWLKAMAKLKGKQK